VKQMKRSIYRLVGASVLAVLAFAASSMNEDARYRDQYPDMSAVVRAHDRDEAPARRIVYSSCQSKDACDNGCLFTDPAPDVSVPRSFCPVHYCRDRYTRANLRVGITRDNSVDAVEAGREGAVQNLRRGVRGLQESHVDLALRSL